MVKTKSDIHDFKEYVHTINEIVSTMTDYSKSRLEGLDLIEASRLGVPGRMPNFDTQSASEMIQRVNTAADDLDVDPSQPIGITTDQVLTLLYIVQNISLATPPKTMELTDEERANNAPFDMYEERVNKIKEIVAAKITEHYWIRETNRNHKKLFKTLERVLNEYEDFAVVGRMVPNSTYDRANVLLNELKSY